MPKTQKKKDPTDIMNWSGVFKAMDAEQARQDKRDAAWNKKHKPFATFEHLGVTHGVWKAFGDYRGGMYFAQKTKNKKAPYRPLSLILLPQNSSKLFKGQKQNE